MKKLYINGINGLYDEFYNPKSLIGVGLKGEYLDANQIFWHQILDDNNIRKIVNILSNNIHIKEHCTYRNLAITTNPNLFIKNVLDAKKNICDQGITSQRFFQYLETLEILCDLYSRFWFYPYRLTLEQGLMINKISSKETSDIALNPSLNPIYIWVTEEILPIICDYNPDLIFLAGPPSTFFFTIAKLIKQFNSNVHICITRHSSEYFSLSKIDFYLKKNTILFSYIDTIILEFYIQTEQQLIETLESKSFLESVNNIIFKNDMGQIIQTAYQQQAEQKIILMGRKYGTNVTFKISPDSIVNVHLEPYKKCYWNKCTFCGINKKYHYNEELSSERLIFQLDNLKNYILKNHIRYVWFIDEAIKPEKLKIIANYILENNLSFLWQVRCRIEEELMKDNLPHLLAKSGLREIRLGLESGSKSVLKHMNKFPEEFDFTIIEKIVSMYNSLGISVHTPIIVGYPEETFSDRQKTYELLSHLKKKYTLFSFNINILGLDISSKLFKEWYKYNIDKIDFPCAPDEYMGNIINWKSSSFNYEQLDEERNNFMRDNLYPWMPHNTLVKPYLFYRLSETIRNTLIWKTLNTNATMIMNEDATFICSHNIVIIPRENDNHYILYQWDSHHYLIANQLFISILKLFDNPITVESGIYLIISNITDKYSYDDLVKTLHKLIAFNFLELVQSERQFKGSTSITLKEYYDKIYSTEDFPYAVKQDNWLTHYGKQIPIGTVLELGVGNGKNIPMLLKKGYKVKGIDISSVAINQLHLKYMRSNCCFEQADICDYNIQPNSYELIVCSMVLHYLEYDKLHEVAQKIQNGLKRNGYLFISVLSKRDPLYKVSQMENPFVKTFFNCESLTALFGKLQIVEISDDYSLEPLRKHPANYFGTILYLGKKS